MYKILLKEDLVPNVYMFRIEAPEIARKAKPGHFIMLRVDETGERVPMTIADWDTEEGSITIVCFEVGTTTSKLASLKTGDYIENVVGPLGLPLHVEKLGTVLCIGGCYGIGSMFPVARAMKEAGNKVITIVEGRSKNLIYWQDKLRDASDELIILTENDAGSAKGWIPDKIEEMVAAGNKPDLVVATGCTFMMMRTSEATRPFGIKTIVHLAPIMVDGTGMCGCCRVSVGGETRFACVHGPEFDGHEVDWSLLIARQSAYIREEMQSLQVWECQNWQKAEVD
ncbi:sulfide/dihydroorotate dehydrogenase-like FAD/NAD-binding protein [Chloroflexota bacterium]